MRLEEIEELAREIVNGEQSDRLWTTAEKFARFILAALPVVIAADAFRDASCLRYSDCKPGDHDFQCPCEETERAVYVAVSRMRERLAPQGVRP